MIFLFAETVTRRGPSWRESTALTAKLTAAQRGKEGEKSGLRSGDSQNNCLH